MSEVREFGFVQDGERIDQIAFRLLGDARRWDEILEENPDLNIWEPEVGSTVYLPND